MRSVEEQELCEKLKQENALRKPSENTTAIVGKVEEHLKRYVVLPLGMALAIALWVIGTHIFEIFEVFPYLGINGPTKRCGKTRLTEVLEQFVARPLRTSNVSEAALFRVIEHKFPTLIIDEAEALADKRSERSQLLVGILNSGHREGATVIRCVGPQHEVKEFRTFCPKAIVAIGSLRETLADRSIGVAMQRKQRTENVERFLFKKVKPAAELLQQEIIAMVEANRKQIEEAFLRFDFEELEDRESENWSSLLSLCEVLAPSRLLELKVTAVTNGQTKAGDDADESLSMRLLSDIGVVLATLRVEKDKLFDDADKAIPTKSLLERLRALEDSPWAESDVNLTPRRLARFLRPFKIYPVQRDRCRGYELEALEACLSRYVVLNRASVQPIDSTIT